MHWEAPVENMDTESIEPKGKHRRLIGGTRSPFRGQAFAVEQVVDGDIGHGRMDGFAPIAGKQMNTPVLPVQLGCPFCGMDAARHCHQQNGLFHFNGAVDREILTRAKRIKRCHAVRETRQRNTGKRLLAYSCSAEFRSAPQ